MPGCHTAKPRKARKHRWKRAGDAPRNPRKGVYGEPFTLVR